MLVGMFFFRVDARIKQKAVDLLIYHGRKILKMDINIDIYIYDIYSPNGESVMDVLKKSSP